MQKEQKNQSRRKIVRVVAYGCGCTTLFFLVVFIFMLFLLRLFWGPLKGMEATEKDFIKNQQEIFIVRDYFAELEYESLYHTSNHYFYPDSEKDGIFAGPEDGYIPIDDVEASNAIISLYENGYQVLGKDSNCIHFVRWSNKDNARGVVYSIDGSVPDESALVFLTKLEPMEEDGWYYFEEDFNEYKKREQKFMEVNGEF